MPASARPLIVATAPLAAALAALAAAFLTRLDRTARLPPEVEGRFYGFFLDHYPLFAFAIVYAAARVLAAAFAATGTSIPRRVLGAAVGIGLVLALSLHPTFGGLALRGGFMTGGMAFLNQMPMTAAYALGAGVAAVVLGAAMGLGVALAARRARRHGSLWRRLARGAGGALAAFVTLWFALALLGSAQAWGLGPWPRRPLGVGEALLAAGCLLAAFLPHVLLVAARMRSVPRAAA